MIPAATVIAYGQDERQRLWVRPVLAAGPVLVVVPGGGWTHGDPEGAFARAATAWGHRRSMHVVTVTHRLLPAAGLLDQAEDVARALLAVQAAAPDWRGDPQQIVVLAHSAGAHLCALVHVGALDARVPALRPWQASLLLDTAALDVPQLMQWPHAALHDRAFGSNAEAWPALSPRHRLRRRCQPVLLGRQPRASRRRVAGPALRPTHCVPLGGRADVHAVNLPHDGMAAGLAEGGALVAPIDRFLSAVIGGQEPAPTLPGKTRPHPAGCR